QWLARPDSDFSSAYDRPGNTGVDVDPNSEVTRISYFYECTDAPHSFTHITAPDGSSAPIPTEAVTWRAMKNFQLNLGYNGTQFPVIRCAWHVADVDRVMNNPGAQFNNQESIPFLNVAYNGNVFKSRPKWEDGHL
ncbi:MAG: hypothetical protein K9N51_11660, partial [Candidatus Pacebacteria bacterium]|nr:hypothetical protein [Candidatus Paceibacterota bacterium]